MTKGRYVDRAETGLAIYNAIKDSGYSQVQLARQMKVSPVMVSRWATGRCLPDLDSLIHLADTLNISIEKIIIKKHS